MESENGRCDVMETRLHSGSLRQKSKVPRARCSQRSDYAESSSLEYRPLRKEHARDCPPQGMSTPSYHQLGDTDEYKEWQRLIGERVCISGVKQGILRYFGRTNFAQGYWCGVELDEPVGKNDGTVNGVVYFACRPNHGIFAPVSKVSKLNDLSACNWHVDPAKELMSSSKQQQQSRTRSNWDYNMGVIPDPETTGKKFLKSSISEPAFIRQSTMRVNLPRNSESFPYDKRSVTEQRDSSPVNIQDVRRFEMSDLKHSRIQVSASNIVKNSPSSRSLSKYGYSSKKNQYYSSNVMIPVSADGESNGTSREPQSSSQSGTGSLQASGFPMTVAEYEQFLRTPTNSGQVSPLASEAKRFNEMPFYDYAKMPEGFLSAFQSHDFSDFEDEADNDDRMSVDYDESLGILTPSQMRDLTLGPEFTSLSDMRGLDFPSSESFDDINELPEDEQVHDVTVFHLSESSATRNVEVSHQNNSGGYGKNCNVANEDIGLVRKTGEFLNSISRRDVEGYSVDSCFMSAEASESHANTYEDFGRTPKLNNLSTTCVLSPDQVNDRDQELSDKYFGLNAFSKTHAEEPPINDLSDSQVIKNSSVVSQSISFTQYAPISAAKSNSESNQNVTDYRVQIDKRKTKDASPKNISNDEMCRKNYDTDSSRDSLSQTESEHNPTLKEKLTVSWEDCLSPSNDCSYHLVERPESVYTVASTDTGYQEDGELEGDVGMTTSIDSTEGTKRFSTTSRDSCIVADEVDGYKIAESNSTSGYSTGLSDSCCNDRAEDDLSSKPMTDEEIQDSVGPCDSEDAFSFHEGNSLSKDTEVLNAEISDVTTETVTALFNDSASDALCETMVEDSTLTEIHDLLLSPEENKPLSPKEAKEVADTVAEPAKNEQPSEHEASKASDKIEIGSGSSSSPAHSVPEKKTRLRSEAQRNAGFNRSTKSNRLCESEADKKKQVAKSPKKNVMSKIKAMIEATSCKTVNKSRPEPAAEPVNRRTVAPPKKSRWEAVTSKIAASLAEEKTKPKAKREIRSRVDTNLTSARQQVVTCKSPKLGSPRVSNCGSMSPISASSRDRRATVERSSAPNQLREGRAKLNRDTKQRPKSPRPGTACITSRSASPVAASESSTTSVSLNSHNSRSKIAHWKGSSSTIASSVPPKTLAAVKRTPLPPAAKTPLQSARTRLVNKKPATVPKIRITPTSQTRGRSSSPTPSSRAERKTPRQSKASKEQNGTRGTLAPTKPVRPPMWLSKAELTQEIQKLSSLCEVRTKELNRLKMETKHVSVGFDAFASLFKYMVEDLNALSVPMLSADLQKTLKQLELAKQDLAYYEREVEEMKAHHCQELNDLSNKLFEVFQGEVTELSTKHQEEMNHLKSEHQKQIECLTKTLNASSAESIAKHEELVAKLQQELINQREELQLFQERELQDLEEKHSQSTKTLQEHIEQLQKKCAELKQHSMGMEDAMRKDTDTKLQWVTARKVDLEKEVESLKAVLEMKNKEIHTIRVQNLEFEKQLEELPLAREKIKILQARVEDLEALMVEKTKLERELTTENQEIKEKYEKESKVYTRLSMENEELQWRLRQAEQSIISGSFSDVLEYPEEESGTMSPAKSPVKSPGPQSMSRSVFFTFVDKDSSASPRTPYRKIMPGFSANYKTSPARTTRSPNVASPRRGKSNSEPPPPPVLCSTPNKKASKKPSSAKQTTNQKRPRSGSDCGRLTTDQPPDVTFISVTGSMASSVSSESSVFEHKERLLEEHREQLLHSLEILREHRNTESGTDEPMTPNIIEEKWSSDGCKMTKSLNALDERWCDSNGKMVESPSFEVDMSRSSEFSDPKTYYHMTFPVLTKEAGMPDCEAEESGKVAHHNGSIAQPIHSSSQSNKVDTESKPTTSDTNGFTLGASDPPTKDENRELACVKNTLSNEDVRDARCQALAKEQNRWRTI